jgi:hypothetical protein
MKIQSIRSHTDRHYFFLLSSLLLLFCLRVAGQLLVALYQVPFLPPMQEWQSGLLPYPVLVVCQFSIIALFAKVCFDFYKRNGFFYEAKKFLAEPLINCAKVYLVANAARLLVWTTMFKHHSWFTGTIPIFFHFVLASFLLVLAVHHRNELSKAAMRKPLQTFSERQKVTL